MQHNFEEITWRCHPVEGTTDSRIGVLQLSRPDQANALNAAMIREITQALASAAKDSSLRAIVIGGKGKHFSAGADLAWMQAARKLSHEENVADANMLAQMFEQLVNLSVPTFAVVQGAAYGGAVGLAACCDVVIAAPNVRFCLSEVKLGILPAVIAPYVARRIGVAALGRYGLSARILEAQEAQDVGLVDRLAPNVDLSSVLREELNLILAASPAAQKRLKGLLKELLKHGLAQGEYTSRHIADARCSVEGRAGLDAFFEKKPAPWVASMPPNWEYNQES